MRFSSRDRLVKSQHDALTTKLLNLTILWLNWNGRLGERNAILRMVKLHPKILYLSDSKQEWRLNKKIVPALPLGPKCLSGLPNPHDRRSKLHCCSMNLQPLLLKGTSVYKCPGSPLSSFHPSVTLSFIVSLHLSLNSFNRPFFLRPFHCASSIYLPTLWHHDLFLSVLLWYFCRTCTLSWTYH